VDGRARAVGWRGDDRGVREVVDRAGDVCAGGGRSHVGGYRGAGGKGRRRSRRRRQ